MGSQREPIRQIFMESGKKFLGEEILIIKKDKGKIHPCQYKSTVCGNLAGTPGPVPDSCADPVSWGAPHTRFQVPSGFPEDVMAGKKKKETRSAMLQVRMTDREMEKISNMAEKKRMSVSSFVRWAIFSKRTHVSVNEDVFTDGMKELLMANGRAAGNLNQIAKNLNSGVSVDEGILQAIRTTISEMIAFNRKLEKMYREHYGNSKTHFEQEC